MARRSRPAGAVSAPRTPRRRQRGAAAVFAAISMIAGLIAAGLAIDLGRLYFTQRDLQRLANMAALDSARVAGGCLGEVPDRGAAALNEALNSVLRNGGQPEWVTNSPTDILGSVGSADGNLRVFLTVPNVNSRAVQVRVSRVAPSRLIPLLSSTGEVRLSALSAAYDTPSALVQVGSRPLTIDPPDEGPLNAAFGPLFGGDPLNVDALSYQALFDAQVPLGAVLDNLGLDNSQADTPTSLGDFILAVADAVGDPAAVAAAQQMYGAAGSTREVVPSELGVTDTASGTFVSAGDLLTAAAATSLDGSPINIPINLPPPLSAGSTSLRLLDPGTLTRLLPGGILADALNFAHNTSVVLQTNTPIDLAAIGATGQLSFFLQAGHSTAEAVAIQCARRGLPEDTVDVSATASLARIGIGYFDDINSPSPQPQPVPVIDVNSSLPLLNLPIRVRITAGAFVDIGQEESETFAGMRAGEVRRLGTPGTTALSSALAEIPSNLSIGVDVSLLAPVSPLLQGAADSALSALRSTLEQAVRDAITQVLLGQIDDILLPQLEMLGVTLGGADVTVAGIDAEEPKLFTH